MLQASFHVVADSSVSAGQVSVPALTWPMNALDDAKYLRVRRNDTGASNIYKVVLRPAASGTQVWVAVGQLGLHPGKPVPVSLEDASKSDYQWHQLFFSGWGWLTLLGLLLGIAGFAIDGAFDVGKYKLIWEVSDTTAFWARVAAWILKIVGVVFVFLQATWFRRD